jgi:leader peptidase (prepilin peptidase) / N-methyltransferase
VTPLIAKVYAFFLGACLGSFLNVCVVRWPRDLSIVKPRSRCPQCGYQLRIYDNVPIVSWLWLRGRCRCCDESISPMYPLVELVVALGWLTSVNVYGVTFTALRVAVFGTILLGVALTDAREYLIPDGFTLTGLAWALATSAFAYLRGMSFTFSLSGAAPVLFPTPYPALVGACTGAGMVFIIGWIGEVVSKREAMGMGDMTLMAFVGAVVGPGKAFLTIFGGATLGAVVFLLFVLPYAWLRRDTRREQTELPLGRSRIELPLVPFGVFLAPAAFAALLWGDALVQLLRL